LEWEREGKGVEGWEEKGGEGWERGGEGEGIYSTDPNLQEFIPHSLEDNTPPPGTRIILLLQVLGHCQLGRGRRSNFCNITGKTS